MAEVVDTYPVDVPRRFEFGWLLPMLIRPRKILSRFHDLNRPVWLTPLLVLTLLAIISVVVAGPIRAAAAQSGSPTELPPDYQWWTPEQQNQYQQAMAAATGPVFTYVLPGLSQLFGVWLGFLILSAVLHLGLTIAGARTNMSTVQNIVAWASVPIMLRYIVQIVAMLATKRLVATPGLSGFAPTGEGWGILLLGAVLALIDLYLIWQVILIIVGVRALPGVATARAVITVLVCVALFLVLAALPAFLSAQFGGVSVTRPFFFF